MQSPLNAKEVVNADTPILFFDCTLADGSVEHWSSRSFTLAGVPYEGRVLRHNLFEAQLASDTQIGGAPRLTFELANADSRLSQIEAQSGFKGSRLSVKVAFMDIAAGVATSDPLVVFSGLMNPPELITENSFRLSAMNRMSTQRSVLPEVRVQRLCPWRFPASGAQRAEAVYGGDARGKYSPFYRCGYSPDQEGGKGNLNGEQPYTDCAHTRAACEARGMFTSDSSGRTTSRFGGVEFVPASILVRGSGQKNQSLSAVQDNQARYNDFVPLIYGTQWHAPDVVFSRNDGNLTRMEVLLGMGEIEGILKVLVNGVEIPAGVNGRNMTSTGWYNLITAGTREGGQDGNFADGRGVALGDPFGSMAYLSVVVPNRVNDGSSIPSVQVLMRGLRLEHFSADGDSQGEQFTDNPAWVLLDVLRRSGYSLDEIDTPSFARVAAWAGETIEVQDAVGGSVMVPRFQCNFALKQRRSSGEIVRAIRNSSRIYLVLNAAGHMEARAENTIALQQSSKPEGSNATALYNGGWPAYEFGPSSIARLADGSSSVRIKTRSAQDTPNRLSVEFQDRFNQYQQDSLSLADGDDADLCGQEVAAGWDAVGVSSFGQAERVLLLGLNRAIQGNLFIEFETSVKALGLLPGDLITVTYAKENLQRTAFRILRITPGASFRTATITAQLHNDEWYSDAVTGIVGGRGWQSGSGSGLPAPVCGTVLDADDALQLGIRETEVTGSDGSANVTLDVAFTAPSGSRGSLVAPLIGLAPAIQTHGGSLAGNLTLFYGMSAVDAAGGESPLSFIAQVLIPPGANTNAVTIDGIGLPGGSAGFHVYRGTSPSQMFRIASNQSVAPSFSDTGLPVQTVLPADPQFDHVNIYWRWEILPATAAAIHSINSVGNPSLQLAPGRYTGALVRIVSGIGAGQERIVSGNDSHTLVVEKEWDVTPAAASTFVICESSWRPGAKGSVSSIPITVPERLGSGVQICARAANIRDEEAAYEASPVTRWIVGQSGGLLADADVPPAAAFGVDLSPVRGGVLDLNSIAFPTLVNTRSIIAGTYRFHFYDEVNGPPPIALAAPISADDDFIQLATPVPIDTLIQIEREILAVRAVDVTGRFFVQRGRFGSRAASHGSAEMAYVLREKATVVPFVKNFFGAQTSGDWKYSLELPNVRIASVELSMTNALGNGAAAVNCYTSTVDNGLRSMGGGQYSFQIAGYLAVQTGAAPDVVVDADRSVRDIFGILRSASAGAGVTLQLNLNGAAFATMHFDPGSTNSNIVEGFGLPPLRANDRISLDVTGVGVTNPGADLTLIFRL